MKTVDFVIANDVLPRLPSQAVTVAQAFSLAFLRLLNQRSEAEGREIPQIDVARAIGAYNSRLTSWRKGDEPGFHSPPFPQLEKIRAYFGVQPWELFIPSANQLRPNRSLDRLGSPPIEVRDNATDEVGGPTQEGEVPNAELFERIRGYWIAMNPQEREQFLAFGAKLATSPLANAPPRVLGNE